VRGGLRPGLLAVAASLFALAAPAAAGSRERMVAEQIEARGIRDPRVLAAVRAVRREAFVPPETRARAHDDTPLAIGHGQTISQPYMVALMTELLGIGEQDAVLEIGTGSGYQAAVLAELARAVYTVEIVPELAARARLTLTREGYRNVHVRQGDGRFGWREYGPYDAIVVTAAAPRVPPALIEQLREGGVLVMPLGPPGEWQKLVRGVKRGGKLRAREVTDVRFVPLTGGEVRGRPRDAPASPPRAPERPRVPAPPRGRIIEEELPGPGAPPPETDRRSRRDARSRVARAPGAPDNGRRCAGGGAASAGARSRGAAPRSAG
jgi:protein-L-isoaspartate(D-aspartate) O-methyltransferase